MTNQLVIDLAWLLAGALVGLGLGYVWLAWYLTRGRK